MKKTDFGTKRVCPNSNCDTKFYDLNRSPIVCPSCGQEIVLEKPVLAEKKVEKKAEDTEIQEEVKSDDAPEIISLEEAESEEITESIPSIDDDESDMEPSEDRSYVEDDEDVSEIVTETEDEEDN